MTRAHPSESQADDAAQALCERASTQPGNRRRASAVRTMEALNVALQEHGRRLSLRSALIQQAHRKAKLAAGAAAARARLVLRRRISARRRLRRTSFKVALEHRAAHRKRRAQNVDSTPLRHQCDAQRGAAAAACVCSVPARSRVAGGGASRWRFRGANRNLG